MQITQVKALIGQFLEYGPYRRATHVSADPAWVQRATQNALWLQVKGYESAHHVQGSLLWSARQMHQCAGGQYKNNYGIQYIGQSRWQAYTMK